jgi:ABC-2 type transport system permease protein
MTTFSYSLSVLLMLLLPVGGIVLLRRRFRAPLILFVVGCGTFIGSQLVHLPLNNWLSDLGLLPTAGPLSGPPWWQTALILGLTAGVCEEGARAAGYALLRRYRRFEDGLMMGLGHGGIEAMVFGGVLTASTVASLMPLRDADLTTLGLSVDQVVAVAQQLQVLTSSPWSGIMPLVERLIAMVLHVTLSILVWQAFNRRNGWYLLAAIGYHAAVDAAAVYLSRQIESPWLLYLALIAMIAPGLYWLWALWPRQEMQRAHRSASLSSQLAVFLAALRKEWMQQGRTKRLLVVIAMFALFGLMSPLLARFTPEILGSLEGAEQFADLIPDPTAADAMTQYIKNVTQFGFLLAVLLGMGAVAGEKERGTAAMILSKPMSRWAFVVSKYVAQAGVYLLGFVVAGMGAGYYTFVLFGAVDVGGFAVINLLLLLWLLVFAAVALLGSALGQTTGAAAGIGLGGSVLLLLAGGLPRVGALAPGGLVAWASKLGMGAGDAAAVNGGALAMSLAIILISLITAVAAFETQEL